MFYHFDLIRPLVLCRKHSNSNGSVSSSGTVTWTTATANYGTVTHVAIMDTDSTSDSAGAGNVLFYGALTSSKTIETGDTFQITAGSLTVSLA